MPLQKALAIKLREYRKKNGLSQEELALRCDIDRTYISLIERQKRNPTLHIIFIICNVIDVAPSKFISEVEQLMKELSNAERIE